MTISKGWVLVFGIVIGALLGASMPSEINSLRSQIRSSTSTLFNTAGRGSQDVGGWVEE